ncbi:hypothetical protein O6H91_20G035900 [Diphasiastrum complanatum]|uniref:Uncharacterized protein n=1 Tax=Diphasiastrum complanatum TaxID=34168 RepID=A0ACC2APG4_DIPCM|nr:hypothetical protein O6H91_20G035900 [Diphasiastrum complanatum]
MSQFAPSPLCLYLPMAIASLVLQGVVALNILTYGYVLNQTQYLNVSDYYLVLQGDCDLVTYHGSQALWRSNTSGKATDCILQMRIDAKLILYDPILDNTFWSLNYTSFAAMFFPFSLNYFLILKSDGNLSIYDFADLNLIWDGTLPVSALAPSPTPNLTFPLDPHLAWTPRPVPVFGISYMPVGYPLYKNSSLKSGEFNLILESDCNLRTKDRNGKILWETNTSDSSPDPNCQLILPQDGNLQIRTGNSSVVWQSKAFGDSSVNWVLSVDGRTGNVSVSDILKPNNVLWTNVGSSKGDSVTWVLVGVIGGCVLIIGIIAAAVALRYYAFANRTSDPAERELQQRLQKNGGKSQALALGKIRQATKNFQQKIGEGGFGEVFHGILADGQEVAVKVLSATSHQSKLEFFNEIELLSVVHHKNLVSLVGYCLAPKDQILVYEYMSGGDLRGRLQGERAAENPLSWKQRTEIILQVAEGIEYLHDKCAPAIIHRDIKSNNILLSEKVVAKVADFGLSKLRAVEQEGFTHITTLVKGTAGYLDPEYHESGKLTEKSDVYAFGVVLMEILTGHNQLLVVHKVTQAWRSNQLDGLADPNLKDIFDRQEFSTLVKLSLSCVMKKSSDRPSMPQVVQILRQIASAQVEPLQYEAKCDEVSLHTQILAYAFESEILDEHKTSEFPILSSFSESSSNKWISSQSSSSIN